MTPAPRRSGTSSTGTPGVDWRQEGGLDAVAGEEKQPQGPVPPGGGGDDRGDAVKDVAVGDDGNGQQFGRGRAGRGVSHAASLARFVTYCLCSTTVSDK